MPETLQSLFGLTVLTGLGWLFSERRAAAGHWRTAVVGVGVQILVALALLRLPPVQHFFSVLNAAVVGSPMEPRDHAAIDQPLTGC